MGAYHPNEESHVKKLVYKLVKLLVGTAHHQHFAAMSGFEGATGIDRTGALYDDLRARGFAVVPGQGAWKGEKEPSLLILPASADGIFSPVERDALLSLCREYFQNSYFLNLESNPYFHYADGHVELVGEYQRYVTGDDARERDGFSEFAGFAFSVI